MPVVRHDFGRVLSVDVRGPLSAGEVESLAAEARLSFVTVRSDEPEKTWEDLNEHLFARRPDVTLGIDSFFPGGADLTFLRHTPDVRRLCVSSVGTEEISSLDSIAALRELEHLTIGSPALRSFDVLDCLPPDRLRELRLLDTSPHRPSLRPVARFVGLKRLDLHGHATDIDAIRDLRALESLELQLIRLDDFDLLRAFPNLASIQFGLGGVKDAAVLGELERLKHLHVFQSRGFDSLSFLTGMRGLQWLELQNLPKVTDFPDLSRLARLRRVSLTNLKRLESLAGLAKAPALEEYLHLVVPLSRRSDFFLCLLDRPTLRRFRAIFGSKKRDDAMRELASHKGKLPFEASPFVFES
jgi:hypothetical protein